MGILGKVVGKVAEKAVLKTVEEVVKSGVADNALNKVSLTCQKITGKKTQEDLLEEGHGVFQLVMKKTSEATSAVVGDYEKNLYSVYDINSNEKYLIKGSETWGKHNFTVYDSNAKVVGTVKKKFIAVPFLFEKEAKDSIIEVNGEQICSIRTYISFGERSFQTDNGFQISMNSKKTGYEIKHKNRKIGQVDNAIVEIREHIREKYILAYEQIVDELLVVMFAVAIDAMFFED